MNPMEPSSKPLLLRAFDVRLPIWLVIPLLAVMTIGGAAIGFLGGIALTPATNCPASEEACDEFWVFWQTWDHVDRNFFDPTAVDPKRMTEGAIRGMLDSLGDQGHTRFLSADEAQQWLESLSAEFEGIGAYVDVRDGQALIVAPIEGSPAEAAGIKAGDIILKVNDKDTNGWTIEELVSNVRGPKGSEVRLTIMREGEDEPLDVTVRRDTVEIPSVTWAMLPDNVALVRLNSFTQRAAEEMRLALREAQDQGAQGIVLDLRSNPGGLVNEAVGIASQFLREGTVVLLEEDRTGRRTPTTTSGGGVALDIPLVVLVDTNTASSSEILSGAFQDANRAIVIGETTIGTGTVLTSYTLQDGAQLLLGTSQWLTPDGRVIRRQGITPDIEVTIPEGGAYLSPSEARDLSMSEIEEYQDTQVLRALEELRNQQAQNVE